MAAVTKSEVIHENGNKLVHPWFDTYWMALVWPSCGVSSRSSVVSELLCIDHSENTHDFSKWPPVQNRRSYAKTDIDLFIPFLIAFKWDWFGLSSMHCLWDPLSPSFFPPKQLFGSHLKSKWPSYAILVKSVNKSHKPPACQIWSL